MTTTTTSTASERDPYRILDLSHGAGEEEIRKRYLELVRRHSPERDPERFAAIRAAYEQLRDPVTRVRSLLFEEDKGESLRDVLVEVQRRLRGARIPTQTLLSVGRNR